jgi:hypothetical protein
MRVRSRVGIWLRSLASVRSRVGIWLRSLAVASLTPGCVLVTGSTDGYTAPDGAAATALTCSSPSECDGGVCCFSLVGQTPASQCQASCDRAFEQACTTAQDCGDGGSCFAQTCPLPSGPSIPVSTCGPVPICTQ